jgi:membrane fusion protein (multidrug efflux system)
MKLKTILLIVFLIIALVIIKMVFLMPKEVEGPKAGPPPSQPVNVTGYVVSSQLMENRIFSSGTVLANEEVILHPEVAGKLVSVFFKEGQQVAKGTLLAKINDADLQAQLRKLGFQLKLAREKSERLKGILSIQGISQQEYDEAANQLQVIAADMDYTRALIAKTEIRAPFSGRIGLRQVSVGSYVSPTSTLASIQQTSVLKLDFTIPEKYAHVVKLGDRIQFMVDNATEKSFATVMALEPKIDASTRNLLVRAICNEVAPGVLPGAFARIEMVTEQKNATIMIPTEAVIPELKGKKVFVSQGGLAIPKSIETGTRNDQKIEVLSGLTDGDTVIVTGIMSLKPKAPVKIIDIKQ